MEARLGLGKTARDLALRDTARRDDPDCAIAAADIAAWERAEGWGSEAATDAIARKDVERWIPGLPARRTFKVLGWVIVSAVVVDCALAWWPPSDAIDALDTSVRFGTACLGVAVAAWSILSEVRGWDGSDAATWFHKARFDRIRRQLETRHRTLSDTLIAVGAEGLVVYRNGEGSVTRKPFAPDAILGLSLEARASHMALRLATPAGILRFEWLPLDPAFEAAVARLASEVERRGAMVATPLA